MSENIATTALKRGSHSSIASSIPEGSNIPLKNSTMRMTQKINPSSGSSFLIEMGSGQGQRKNRI